MTQLDRETETARELFDALLSYGRTNDEAAIDALRVLYRRTSTALREEVRVSMAAQFAELAEAGQCSINPLNAFIFHDPSPIVVATATLNAVPMWPGTTSDDPLFGTRELVKFAEQCIELGDEGCAVGIFQGLLLLGDRRVVDAVGPCWRVLSVAGRARLLHLTGMRVHAPVVDWLLDWLEDCESVELANVAGTLSRIAEIAHRQGSVIEVRRALPLWVEPAEPPLQDLKQWPYEQFAERIAPRLRAVALNEEGDRVMPHVLVEWGLPLDGIATDADIEAHERRAAEHRERTGTVPPAALRESMSFPAVFVNATTVLMRRPVPLIAWGLFNPYGPTLNVIGRTTGGEVDYLWYAMLNPFKQQIVLFGSLVGADRGAAAPIAVQLERCISENVLTAASGVELPLVTYPPAFVLERGDEVYPGRRALMTLLGSAGIRCYDLNEVVRQLERSQGNPWERATEQHRGWSPQRDGETGEYAEHEEVLRWLSRILETQQLYREVACFREAWAGSIAQQIRHGNSHLADHAMSLSIFEDLTQQLGLTDFAEVGEALRSLET
jgi:hypothetical protein